MAVQSNKTVISFGKVNNSMRCSRIPIAVLTSILACASVGAEAAADYTRLYESLWGTVNESFYDPHFKGVDWAGVGERYRERAEAIENDAQFTSLAGEMLAEIGSSHLHIRVPERNVRTVGIAARMTTIDGAPLVSDVAALSDAHRQGLRPGDRLLSPPSALRGKLGSATAVEIEHCNGDRSELRIRREQAWWPPEGPGFRWSQIRVRPDTTIGYLNIGRFDDGAAELADRAMSQLMETQALIIDLRNNSGGNTSALRLASYFGNGAEPAVILSLSRKTRSAGKQSGRSRRAADRRRVHRRSRVRSDLRERRRCRFLDGRHSAEIPAAGLRTCRRRDGQRSRGLRLVYAGADACHADRSRYRGRAVEFGNVRDWRRMVGSRARARSLGARRHRLRRPSSASGQRGGVDAGRPLQRSRSGPRDGPRSGLGGTGARDTDHPD